jgi:hypothetical protein
MPSSSDKVGRLQPLGGGDFGLYFGARAGLHQLAEWWQFGPASATRAKEQEGSDGVVLRGLK